MPRWSPGSSPLYTAARKGHAEVVAQLLAAHGTDPNEVDDYGRTPLCITAQEGHADVVAQLLTARGTDPNQATNDGFTPLCIAAHNGRTEVVAQLLAAPGADPSQVMNSTTPLLIAAERGHAGVAALLLDHGADPHAANSIGDTAHELARGNGFPPELLARLDTLPSAATLWCFVRLLDFIEPGLVAIVLATLEDTATCVRVLGCLPWATPTGKAERSIALFKAAQAGSSRICKVLLCAAAGTDPNQANNSDGATPLDVAACIGHAAVVAQLLAAPGTDPNQARDDGTTPLYIAAYKGHAEVIALLLAATGTDPNQANNNGTTPLYIAAQEGYAGVAAQLLNAWLGTMPGAARSWVTTSVRHLWVAAKSFVAKLSKSTLGPSRPTCSSVWTAMT